jgi:hypothetical protein
MSMKRVGQRGLPVALVGAGLPPLPRLLRAAKPYAERMFSYRGLIDFTVPLFGGYLRGQHPLASFTDE